ncbi:MAG: DUF2147 domain-containing protein [Bacteroidota bacterium]
MYIKILTLLASILLPLSASAQSEILGKWLTDEKDAHIEITKSGDEYIGKIVWLEEPKNEDGSPKTDLNNPDEDLQSRPILNMTMLSGFNYSRGQYRGGNIYDARSGNTYKSKMWLEDDDNTLMMRGYWGMFYKTVALTRVVE